MSKNPLIRRVVVSDTFLYAFVGGEDLGISNVVNNVNLRCYPLDREITER